MKPPASKSIRELRLIEGMRGITPEEYYALIGTGMQNSNTPINRARQRHGKPFAHEPGSDWEPHETPVLTQWMANRKATGRAR